MQLNPEVGDIEGRNFAIRATAVNISEENTTMVQDDVVFIATVDEGGNINLDVTDPDEANIIGAVLPVNAIETDNSTIGISFIVFNNDTLFQQRETFPRIAEASGGVISVQVTTGTKPVLREPLRLQFGAGNVHKHIIKLLTMHETYHLFLLFHFPRLLTLPEKM